MRRKKKVYIREKSFIAHLAAKKMKVNAVAIVFGHTIYLHNTAISSFLNDTHWLLHELKHVEQYERLGLMKFIFCYLKESIQKGYYDNKLETEARAAEKDFELLKNYELIY